MNRRALVLNALAVSVAPSFLRAQSERTITALNGDSISVDGEEVRLADIIAPAVNGAHGEPEAFAETARATLNSLLKAPLQIDDFAPVDRWARRVAKVTAHNGEITLQERMIAAGMARVRPESDDALFIGRLLELEREARGKPLGLWRLDRYQVLDATATRLPVGYFVIVEGRVLRAVKTRSRTYLNFGDDYRKDFTITAPSALARRWSKDGLELTEFEGGNVRVRGYLAYINGPSIELRHPLQIEASEDVG